MDGSVTRAGDAVRETCARHPARMPAPVLQSVLFDPGPLRLLEDAEDGISYQPGVFDPARVARWFDALRDGVQWHSMRRPMYDRVVDVPRLVASYRLDSPGVPEPLPQIAARVRAELGIPFNTVGLNYYRNGNDSVAPHNDKLDSLVRGHPIALLSLGGTRRMTIRAKLPPRNALHVDLEAGSLLVMSHASQMHYDHGIPKVRGAVAPRISLAFRVRPTGVRSKGSRRVLQPARTAD